MYYKMVLIINGNELTIPVLPDKIEISSPGKNESMTVLETGEILMLKQTGLRTISWNSLFPAHPAPYCDPKYQNAVPNTPSVLVKSIQDARERKKPIRLLMVGTDLDINFLVGIESFDYDERGGEVGDIYYKIKLKEWKDYAPKKIILSSDPNQPAAEKAPDRGGSPPEQKNHTVVSGDSLWSIAKQHYGEGNRYKEIYLANQSIIDSRNRGTGNQWDAIYIGQVLRLP